MNLALLFVGAFLLAITVFVVLVMLHRRSFKHGATILVQNGDDPNNCVLVNDRFRVRKDDASGYLLAEFKKLRKKTTAPSNDRKLWFWKKNLDDYYQVTLKTEQQARKFMTQGAIFFMTSEGEFHPVKVNVPRDGDGRIDLQVINEDKKAFIYHSIRRQKDFQRTDKDKIIQAVLMGGTMVIIAALMIFSIVYLNNTLSETIAGVCREVSNVGVGNGLVDQVQGVVGA